MALSLKAIRPVLDGNACQLAFRIAQSVERTLVARAVESAVRHAYAPGNISVTVEDVKCALDGLLLEEACSRIGITLDGKTKAVRRKTLAG